MFPPTNKIRSPLPGERDFYVCLDCGHRFMDKTPLIPILDISKKCPDCGSNKVKRDDMITH